MNVGNTVRVWVPMYRSGYEAHGVITKIFTTHCGETCYEVEVQNMIDTVGNVHEVGWLETTDIESIE